jgi:hypothetical protein
LVQGKLLELAPQEFVDCVPNPDQCGGSGGCAGSTEEYGFACGFRPSSPASPRVGWRRGR